MDYPDAAMHRTADLTALADHMSNSAHESYRLLRGPLWQALRTLGFTGGDVLVQGDGAPTMLNLPDAPERAIDFITARLTNRENAANASDAPGLKGGFGDYDLVIATMPWLDVQLRGIGRHELRTDLHVAKTLAAIKLTKPGGLVAILANHSLMDRAPTEARAAIGREASFLGAIRFPAGVLRAQAGTDDIVDLILLSKPASGVPDGSVRFTKSVQVTVDRFITTINQYFDDHPEHMLGSICPEVQIWNTSDFTIQGADRGAMLTEYRQALLGIVGHAIVAGIVPRPAELDPATKPPGGWVISGARRYLPDALRDASSGGRFLDTHPEPPASPAPPPPPVDL
ncbi:hypothetical protein Xcel_2349 [Xylanimonas cellulosilytica DSM 15894]|uniref:Uncharacterized protein n=1 Tax=Xylanimonas cellulosilytica (strain DSM 15894 / JCM 12276 / CECT 5975 / KCTC 9989 / LMG 20990 / NBRC 107835 / XIL07) TaxID=446471 RepID=D1BVP6_XYLCX|nr:hypothetical protein [Xylanimonas cellulosilytica]ACZ31365.1 hypothetical protein Xcel_2349 [Xylanimonas cellulosilytica DSM 15894]